MEITLPAILIGILASVLTEILKYVPAIKNSQVLTSLVAIVLVAIGAFIINGYQLTLASFISVVIFAFSSYKLLIQPVAAGLSLKTQDKTLSA